MTHFSRFYQSACMVIGLACATVAHAQQQPPQQNENPGQESRGPEHRKPPPESLAACKSLSAGAACNFTSPKGAEVGTCGAPEGKPLACRPARNESKDHGMGGKDKPKS